jgi:hypothetical protein
MKQHKVAGEAPPPTLSEGQPRGAPDDTDGLEDTNRLPKITSNLVGIEVVENGAGRAVGQWILQVRCQCGRRWFEVEAIDSTVCPRCKRLVYVDVLDSDG